MLLLFYKGRIFKEFKNMENYFSNIKNKYSYHFVGILLSIFLIALIVFVAVSIPTKIKEGRHIDGVNRITVSGTGEVYAKPDLALINFSVVSEAKTVNEATSDNTEKMNAAIDFVKETGVEEKDLKTISFNVYPRYEYRKVEMEIYPYPPGKRVLVGYEITQTLQVKIRDLGKIGEILDGVTDIGINQVGNLSFTIDKEDEFKEQAREEAIEKAKAKAEILASQLGVDLVKIIDFSETGYTPISPMYYTESSLRMDSMGGSAPQIETGENKIEVSVSIVYEIN